MSSTTIASESPRVPVDYSNLFREKFTEPKIFSSDYEYSEGLVTRHCEHVLEASNEVHHNIDEHKWDNLTAEQVFHEIHWTHIGKDDPEKHIIATADFALVEDLEPTFIWNAYKSAADHLGSDQSFRKGEYRTTTITWGERGRGVVGAASKDLKELCTEVFKLVDQRIGDVKSGEPIDPEEARNFSIVAGTILDIMHPKKDCNGRSCEDFIVWIQSQLIKDPEEFRFLSDSGLRARGYNLDFPKPTGGTEFIVSNDNKEDAEQMRMRIDDRTRIVVELRRRIYDDLVWKMGLSKEEMEEKMVPLTYDRDIHAERERMRGEANSLFKELIMTLDPQMFNLRRSGLEKLFKYFEEKGVNKYKYLKPEEVFKNVK